jgi:hypothetical protein
MNSKDLTRGEMALIIGALCGQIEVKREAGVTHYSRSAYNDIIKKFIQACPELSTLEPLANIDLAEKGADEYYWGKAK